jgi:phosphoribosyl-ATP pyrophosphohydrolase/phosphoribosyl-AMP cyclohydrolase
MTEDNMLYRLQAIIQDRKQHPQDDSYTSRLFAKGIERIAQKVGEEATEVVIAALRQSPETQREELADLFYHTLVLMAAIDVSLDDVCEVLEKRHQPREL